MLLTRYLARGGVASRKEALQMVAAGRVRVDNVLVQDSGFLVSNQVVTVDEVAVTLSPCRLFTYHKPIREVVSKAPKNGQISCFDQIASRYPSFPLLHSVGRLDYMSEGLLLFTNAGELSNCLEHPFNAFERQYHVELTREYRALPSLLNALTKSVEIDGVHYQPVLVTDLGNRWVHVRLTEGKNREIRKLFAQLGLEISRLKRVAYGPFNLGELQANELREQTVPEEVFHQIDVFAERNEARQGRRL